MKRRATMSRRGKWLIAVFVSLLVLLVGLPLFVGATLHILGRMATTRWEAKLAEWRAQGEPITFEEIEARRVVVPDELNGALIIEELSDLLGGPVDGVHPEESIVQYRVPAHVLVFNDRPVFDAVGGTPRYAIDASREFIEEHMDILEALGELETRPTGRFALDTENTLEIPLVMHSAPVRTASRLLRLDAVVKLADGDLPGASADVLRMFNLAGTLRDEPAVISRLVSIAVQAMATQTVEDILTAGELDSGELTRLADVIDWHLNNMGNRPAFRGERASLVGLIEDFANGDLDLNTLTASQGTANAGQAGRLLPRAFVRANQVYLAESLNNLVRLADNPSELMDEAARQEAEVPKLGWRHSLAKMLMPPLANTTVLMAQIRAEMATVRAAIAVEQHRLAHGVFPGSLAELVPTYLAAVPTDPFTGKPLLFRAMDSAFVVYSVGRDRADDGGSVERVEDEKRPRDTGVRLLPPDRRGVLITDEPPPEDEQPDD